MGVRVTADSTRAKEDVFNKDLKITNQISGINKSPSSKLNGDRRSLDGMSPLQEYCNAISMIIPGLVCMYLYKHQPYENWWSWRMSWMTFSVLIHLPFSCSYHVLLAKRMLEDAVDNTARRLDQSFIHFTCLVTGVALSQDEIFSTICVILNLYFISRLWAAKDAGLLERMGNIGVGALFYRGERITAV